MELLIYSLRFGHIQFCLERVTVALCLYWSLLVVGKSEWICGGPLLISCHYQKRIESLRCSDSEEVQNGVRVEVREAGIYI